MCRHNDVLSAWTVPLRFDFGWSNVGAFRAMRQDRPAPPLDRLLRELAHVLDIVDARQLWKQHDACRHDRKRAEAADQHGGKDAEPFRHDARAKVAELIGGADE